MSINLKNIVVQNGGRHFWPKLGTDKAIRSFVFFIVYRKVAIFLLLVIILWNKKTILNIEVLHNGPQVCMNSFVGKEN